MKVTIYDIAEKAEISYAAVSTILNSSRPHRYSAKTVARVRQVARELGYSRNHFATALKAGKTNCIGFMGETMRYWDRAYLFNTRTQAGMEWEMRENESEYSLIVFSANLPDSLERSMNLIRQHLVDGVIFTKFESRIPEFEEKMVPVLQENGIPFVLVHAMQKRFGYPNVGLDNRLGGYLAGSHLIQNGLREIGYFTGNPKSVRLTEPLEGLKKAMSEAGFSFSPKHLYSGILPDDANRSYAADYDFFLKLKDLPEALFIPDDYSARDAVRAFRARGLRVPEDIAVVGFEDLNPHEKQEIELTTLAHPYENKGRAALRMLVSILKGDMARDEPRQVLIEPELVVRNTA